MESDSKTDTPKRAVEFDPEFNAGQILLLPGTDAVDVAIDSKDRIYVVGGTTLRVNGEYIISALNYDGTNREDFNGGEPVRNTFMPGAYSLAQQVAVLPDGKILILGVVDLGGSKFGFALARYLPNGTLDLSYGVNGHVVPVFDFCDVVISRNDLDADGNEPTYLYTGKTYLSLYGGRTYISGLALTVGARKAVTLLMCLDGEGSLVQAFGNKGCAVIEHPEHHLNARSMLVTNDYIYLVGHIQRNPRNYKVWVRVRLDGRLDTHFGKRGFITDMGPDFHVGAGNFNAVALHGNLKLLGAGSSPNQRFVAHATLESIDLDGGKDPDFNDGELVVTTIGLGSIWFDCAIQSDGSIVTCGKTGPEMEEMLVGRYLPSGRLDTGFGDHEGWTQFRLKDEVDTPVLALDSNDDVVVAGRYSDDRNAIPFVFRLKG